jgi:hypothetical protein
MRQFAPRVSLAGRGEAVQLEKGQCTRRSELDVAVAKRAATLPDARAGTRETLPMKISKIIVLAMFAAFVGAAPAKAFCLINCEPKPEDARKVFENLIKSKFDKDAVIEKFEITRFWPLDVEGAGHAGYEFYYTASVRFPNGANLQCKPDGAPKAGCSDNVSYYSTTIQNQMIKDKQYIEPGRVIEFKDETRFDQEGSKWKGQDGNFY